MTNALDISWNVGLTAACILDEINRYLLIIPLHLSKSWFMPQALIYSSDRTPWRSQIYSSNWRKCVRYMSSLPAAGVDRFSFILPSFQRDDNLSSALTLLAALTHISKIRKGLPRVHGSNLYCQSQVIMLSCIPYA